MANIALNEDNRLDIEAWVQEMLDETNALMRDLMNDDEQDVEGWVECLERIDGNRLDIRDRLIDIRDGRVENEPDEEEE